IDQPDGREFKSSAMVTPLLGYVCGDLGLVIKTTDGGLSGTVLTTGTTEKLYSIDFVDADTGYAVGAHGAIIKTTNGGTTWTSLSSPITNTIYTIDVVSANNIYIGTASSGAVQHLSRSTDYGATWVDVTPVGFTKTIWSICFVDANHGWFASQDGGKVYYTTDGGTTWGSTVTSGVIVPNSVYFESLTTGFITNNNNGDIYKTTDGGLSWTGVASGLEAMYSVSKFGSSYYACGKYGALYKSTDVGDSWNVLSPTNTTEMLRQIRFKTSTFGLAGGGSTSSADNLGFLLKTTDAGLTWADVGFNFTLQVYSFAIPTSDVWYAGTGNNKLFKTTDAGATFTEQTNPIVSTTADFYDMGFSSELVGYAASSTGKIIKTIDGGANWTLTNSPFGSTIVYGLKVFNDQKVIAVGGSAKAYMTLDGGDNWTALTTNIPGSFFAIGFLDSTTGYIGGYSSPSPVMSKTTDGGLTWNAISFPASFDNYGSIWGLACKSNDIAWFSDINGNILYTQDGGASWTQAKKINNNGLYSMSIVGNDLWTSGNGGTIIKGYSDPLIPVELSSFTAAVSGKDVILNWTTATEMNNSGFQIERKLGSTTWAKVGFVEGKGTTTEKSSYVFNDKPSFNGSVSYRLKQIDLDGSFKYSNVVEVNISAPSKFELSQNYPNPFNPNTTIKYSVAAKSQVELNIYNILGSKVASLVNEIKEAGSYQVDFNASQLSSGVYFYELNAGNFTAKRKMILLK
ncbi:MAG: T9SS type A sorting domain-containing protein, partial [Ignavibacteriaceae bacterium]|nr:T9SS type A sorting domain-containing protein [Ignavibacteriaceae bacterium]